MQDTTDFAQWWYGTRETGAMDAEREFTTEPPAVCGVTMIKELCPSLTRCRVAVIVAREVNGRTFFAGRLSDSRFLFAQNEAQRCVVAVAPECGPPLDAPFRTARGDIASALGAVRDAALKKQMTNGCAAFVVNGPLRTVTELLRAMPFQ